MTTTKKKEESKPQNQVSKSFDKASVKKQEELSSSTIPFPWKVHQLLNDAETQGFTHIVSWLPGHTAFRVHKQKLFVQEIMPRASQPIFLAGMKGLGIIRVCNKT